MVANRIGRRTILVMLQIAVAPIFASMPDAFADELVGQASIIDGDTLARIRLWSVDAPQSGQALPERR